LKHTEQRGIWIPTQHLLWDQGKPRKTLIELVGRSTFRMLNASANSPALNTRTLASVPGCAVALLNTSIKQYSITRKVSRSPNPALAANGPRSIMSRMIKINSVALSPRANYTD
jgi:hypothetical protein